MGNEAEMRKKRPTGWPRIALPCDKATAQIQARISRAGIGHGSKEN
jgi:hypothetical protein